MAFYLCATMPLFAGSYNTTAHTWIPRQVPTQGANADRCTGDQLIVANVANQGPSCSTWQQAATGYLPSTSYTGESYEVILWIVNHKKEHM